MRILAVLFLALVLTSGCRGLLPDNGPAAKLYTLNPGSVTTAKRAPHALKVVLPQVAPGLDTERVALRNGNNMIDYYADVKWAGTVSTLVQSLLVEGFDNAGAMQSVGSDLVTINDDYQLLIEIRDFQIEQQSDKQAAHIRLVAKLARSDTNDIVMTRSYNQLVAAKENTMQAIMAAFDTAYQNTSRQLIADVTARLNTSPTPVKKK